MDYFAKHGSEPGGKAQPAHPADRSTASLLPGQSCAALGITKEARVELNHLGLVRAEEMNQ